MKDTVGLIDRAIQILEIGGWQQHLFGPRGNINVPHCMYGAVQAAALEGVDLISVPLHEYHHLKEEQVRALRYLDQATKTHTGGHFTKAFMYNDEPSTTHEDVLLVMKEARERAAEGK